jgi:hypothetical protein
MRGRAACAWVKLMPEGESVADASPDAVVAESTVSHGRQVLGDYRCAQ